MLAREMTTRAIREPGLRDSHEDVYALWSRAIADVIRDAQAAGEVDAQSRCPPRRLAPDALVEGLGTWLLTGMATRRQCRALVRDSVARELGE